MTARNVARRGVAGHGMGGPADVRRPASPASQPMDLPVGAIERDVRRAIGVARRIARNPFIAAAPTAHQLAFALAEEREVLLTGSGGCGKTVGLLTAALADVDRPGYRALLVQRTLAGPVTLAELAREWLDGSSASWDSTARVWRFPSGASLDLGHERYAYVAGQYHFIGLDDATLFSLDEYRKLFQGLLSDSQTRVIYQQASNELGNLRELLQLNAREVAAVGGLSPGVALWKVGQRSFVVEHLVSRAERWVVDTEPREAAGTSSR